MSMLPLNCGLSYQAATNVSEYWPTLRNVLLATALAVMCMLAVVMPPIAFAQQQTGTTQLSAQSSPHRLQYRGRAGQALTLIAPTDPGFDEEMALSFPEYKKLRTYPAWRQFVVLLRNDTTKTARAYEVIWRLHGSDSSTSGGVSEQMIGVQQAITTPLELRWPGRKSGYDKSLRPGEIRLLTPSFNGLPSEWKGFRFSSRHNPRPALPNSETITADVDCVVYGNGSFAGPNKDRLLLRYFVTRDAQHDEALSVFRALQSSSGIANISAALDLRSKIGSASAAVHEGAMSLYVNARSRTAQELQEVLNTGGSSDLQSVVRELVKLMPPHQRFTSLGGQYHLSKFVVNGVPVSPMD